MTPSLPMVIERLAAAEARCNEYVAQNMRQAQRLADLEEAVRPFVEYWKRCDEADAYPWALTPEDWTRLAKALER